MGYKKIFILGQLWHIQTRFRISIQKAKEYQIHAETLAYIVIFDRDRIEFFSTYFSDRNSTTYSKANNFWSSIVFLDVVYMYTFLTKSVLSYFQDISIQLRGNHQKSNNLFQILHYARCQIISLPKMSGQSMIHDGFLLSTFTLLKNP